MATPGRRKAPRARRTPLATLRTRALRRRPAAFAGLLVAGVVGVVASTPVVATVAQDADSTPVAATMNASAPSLEEHIEQRREAAVSRSSSRAALTETAKQVVAGAAEAAADPSATVVTPSGKISGKPCASGSSVESGLTANAISVHRAVCAEFPSVTSYGGVRSGDGGEHGTGHALDIMVSGATGDAIADFVRANASKLGVTEVLWAQKIWTTQRGSEGWRPMSDRGSSTANHYDHVHVTVG
ncbi:MULTISPECIES: hypothetical protein [Mumia]|uniref:ARB-07466-like C-terminal domain-containing protein n=1 Tax=Mumia xiangluensis TaxID=1678900 RepID=A0ABW1QI91_9ACTN|nr:MULTISPECIES: hypothetical protein [Mumia]